MDARDMTVDALGGSHGKQTSAPAASQPRVGLRHGGLVFVSVAAIAAAAVYLAAALSLPGPWIVPDEFIYSELAKSLGSGSLPGVRGEVTWGYGILYPTLIAPAWALFDDPHQAYVAAKVVNAVVLSLTAFPAYFLARKFVDVRAAVPVAVLTVFVPSMLYSGTLLTEVALYPAFVLALLGLASCLRRPTRRNQLLAIGGIVLACAAKPLAVVLVPAYVLAVVQLGYLDRRDGGSFGVRVKAHSTALGLLGAMALVAVFGPTLLAGRPDAMLGVYGVVLGHVDLSSAVIWFVRHVAELDLYVAIVPFAATLVLIVVSFTTRADRATREFAALAGWTIVGLLGAVAAYASKPLAGGSGYIPTESRLHERNMFVVVPLLFVGLALWLERGRPGSRRVIWACAVVSALLPAILPLDRLRENVNFQAPALVPWMGDGISRLWPLTIVPLAVAATAALVGRGHRSRVASWAIVGIVFAGTTLAAHSSMSTASDAASTVGIGRDTRWIDRAVPSGAQVLALWVAPSDVPGYGRATRDIWMSEFFNRTVGTVVEVGTPMPYDLPHLTGSIERGVLRTGAGTEIRARFVLAPCRVGVKGQIVGTDKNVDMVVYRVPHGPVHVRSTSGALRGCGEDL